MHNTKYEFIIPFQLPWGWSADYQRQTCLELSKRHKVIAYMKLDRQFFLKALFKPVKKYPKITNIKFFIPYDYIPFQRFSFIRKLNDILSFKIMEYLYMGKDDIFLWIFDPIFYPLINLFKGKSIYDCVDVIWNRDKNLTIKLKILEDKIIHSVDYFFVNSHSLYELHKDTRIPDKLLPQGFNLKVFENTADKIYNFPKNKPLIGFVGAINQRLNFKLITDLVVRNPQWNFVLWGPLQSDNDIESKKTNDFINTLSLFKNFITGISSDRNEVPAIIEQFDIAIIPYDISQEFNKYCFPMKLFEYFYLGKPVISTPIKELMLYSKFVKIETTGRGWENQIKTFLKKPYSINFKDELKYLAISHSWESKIKVILNTIRANM